MQVLGPEPSDSIFAMSDLRSVPDGLRDVHRPPGTAEYLRQVWDRRQFATYVAVSELRSRQMKSVMGNIWHVLNPLLQMAIYYVIFGLLVKLDRGVDNFVLFLGVGVFLFLFTQRSTIAGANSMSRNKGMVRTLSFPRAILPVSSTLTEVMAMAGPLIVIYAVAVATGEPFALRWFLIIPLLAVQSSFNLGLAFFAARATNAVSDTTQVLPFVFRLLFYASGVLFNVESYIESGSYAWAFEFNPLYCILTTGRWCMLGGTLDTKLLAILLGYAIIVPVLGLLWFRRGEGEYGRD